MLRRWSRGAGAATRAGFWGFQGKQCSHDASAVVGVPEGALAAVCQRVLVKGRGGEESSE